MSEREKHYLTRAQKDKISVAIKIVVAIIFFSPVFLGLLCSFVPDEFLLKMPSLKTIFSTLTYENYVKVWKAFPVVTYNKNSLIMCAIVIVMQIGISALAAYPFAYLDFKGKNLLFTLVLIAMMIPGQVVMITNFLTVRKLKLLNTYLGMTITGFVAGRTLFLFRQSYKGIPKEMKEAATVDGCKEMRYLWQFALPLSLPSAASLAIMIFIGEYNAYLWPLLIARSSKMYTVQIGMELMINPDAMPTNGRMLAAAMLSLIFPTIVFIFGQDYILRGMLRGGVKG